MKQFIKIMKALSDPSRVKILKMLQRRMMCVCEIQEALGIAQSTASKHLKILEDAGLATFQKDGLWVNYRLADGGDSTYARTILAHLNEWLEDDPHVSEITQRLPEVRRDTICRK
ncbi:MAG: metalloregulator ArsR/SmtB family transcription factor [Desulfobacterales bacterium]|nr:metalloregulator ArsR/SmtB family transcription factor [Desulfobacterales bacterium]